MLTAAILSGGLATRLRPVTETIPKSLIEVAGEPFVAHQLRLLRARGIERVVLCTGFLGEMIQEFVGDGSRFGLQVDYSFDGPVLLGTGGALRQALPLLGEAFFVVYGDSYLPCDYRSIEEFFLASGKQGLMTVYNNEGQYDTSNVEYAGGSLIAYDKKNRTERMRHIDYGLGIFRRPVFENLPPGPCDLAAVYQDLLARGELAAVEVPERFYETGSFAGIRELSIMLSGFTTQFLSEVKQVTEQLDVAAIDQVVAILAESRAAGGRLFILGVGGSAANASHAVNDFRKIGGFEAYAPTDNVSELTARTNDEGWSTVFESWLRGSRLRPEDCILVFSVGGGNLEKGVSANLVTALQYAKSVGAKTTAIVGRDGGYAGKVCDAAVIIPTVNPVHVTPLSEAFQAVVWHLFVSHPALKVAETKWESVK
jgi:D-sedoheptulose 7-phosphate isomerase